MLFPWGLIWSQKYWDHNKKEEDYGIWSYHAVQGRRTKYRAGATNARLDG